MAEKTVTYFVLVYGKEITTVFFAQVNFDIRIEPEAITQAMIELPAKLVVLYSSNDTEQPRVGKKIFCQFVYIQFKLHA